MPGIYRHLLYPRDGDWWEKAGALIAEGEIFPDQAPELGDREVAYISLVQKRHPENIFVRNWAVLTWKGRNDPGIFAHPALWDNRVEVIHLALDWARTMMGRGGKLTVCLQSSGPAREWFRRWAYPKHRGRGGEVWDDDVGPLWKEVAVHVGTFNKEEAVRHREFEAELLMQAPKDPEEAMLAEVQAAFVRRAVFMRKVTEKWVSDTNEWEQSRGNPLPYDKWTKIRARGMTKVEVRAPVTEPRQGTAYVCGTVDAGLLISEGMECRKYGRYSAYPKPKEGGSWTRDHERLPGLLSTLMATRWRTVSYTHLTLPTKA